VDEMRRMERREWMRLQREKLDRSHRDELDRRKLESKEIDGPVRTRERLRGRLEKYDITPEDFDRLMASQGYACGICRLPMESPQVDHDHHTGFVRGLLCVKCNMSIGQLGDTADALMRAVNYLQCLRNYYDRYGYPAEDDEFCSCSCHVPEYLWDRPDEEQGNGPYH
jgi:hypothetical protein